MIYWCLFCEVDIDRKVIVFSFNVNWDRCSILIVIVAAVIFSIIHFIISTFLNNFDHKTSREKWKYIFFIFRKNLEEWKKLGKKFRRPGKNTRNVGRMEEALEEENNSKLQNIFSFIFQKNLEEWKKLGKKFIRPAKL